MDLDFEKFDNDKLHTANPKRWPNGDLRKNKWES
jgi:hypothetical protein